VSATPIQSSENSRDHIQDGIEFGNFAPSNLNERVRESLVVATFNIRYGVGAYLITGSLLRRAGLNLPKRRAGLVTSHLQKAARAFSENNQMPSVDVLALQEADKETVRAGDVHVARELARRLRTHYAHVGTNISGDKAPQRNAWYLDFEEHINPSEKGGTGLAMLSRVPFNDAARIELPWTTCQYRPHLALSFTVNLKGRDIRLFNSHIDPHASTNEQLRQHQTVLEHAAQFDGPVILLGDFNTLRKSSLQAMRRLLEAHGYVSPFQSGVATWRAGLLRLHADWIFVRGLRVLRYGVARGLSISDHWPVWAEVSVEA
jgi:endonuclease/exonuclease/phosphatase family metal-dependent hydrolase